MQTFHEFKFKFKWKFDRKGRSWDANCRHDAKCAKSAKSA